MTKLELEINKLHKEFTTRQDDNHKHVKSSLEELSSSLHSDYVEFKQAILDTKQTFTTTLDSFEIQLNERCRFVGEIRQIYEVNVLLCFILVTILNNANDNASKGILAIVQMKTEHVLFDTISI